MASGVFGTPITLDTVIASGLYGDDVTQKDCADYAEKMITAGGKDEDALMFVNNLKLEYGDGIATKCVIYNATGTTINLADSKDWHGHIYDSGMPPTIMNGQWGAFLHVHPTGAAVGSAGAAVYRSLRPEDNNNSCDWLFSWSIPFWGSNGVYTEIREPNHFGQHWDYIYDSKLENAGQHSQDKQYGYLSDITIGGSTTTEARAEFKWAF